MIVGTGGGGGPPRGARVVFPADPGPGPAVDRVHPGEDVQPGLAGGSRHARDPEDDDREEHDRHHQDQDGAHDFRYAGHVPAQPGSGSHGAAPFAGEDGSGAAPSLYNRFWVTTIRDKREAPKGPRGGVPPPRMHRSHGPDIGRAFGRIPDSENGRTPRRPPGWGDGRSMG